MVKRFIYKIFIVLLVVLSISIISKKSTKFKDEVYKNVFENTISFSKINSLYTKYLGNILPFKLGIAEPVFNEKLEYIDKKGYMDGVLLTTGKNYLIPAIMDGIVIFGGIKDGVNTIIILNDEVEVWYENISNTVKIYDYVTKGSYIGNTLDDKLYLLFKKNGEVLDYNEYIN